MHITDKDTLLGLPEQVLKIAEENARERNLEGWILTLDYPCYSMVMKYLAHREFRWLMYEAYVTRASDQGPDAGRFDNSAIMENLIRTRYELAKLLGFNNFAEYSLKTKMAGNPRRVLTFLHDLVEKSKSAGEKDIEEVKEIAKLDGIQQLEAWDLALLHRKITC